MIGISWEEVFIMVAIGVTSTSPQNSKSLVDLGK